MNHLQILGIALMLAGTSMTIAGSITRKPVLHHCAEDWTVTKGPMIVKKLEQEKEGQ